MNKHSTLIFTFILLGLISFILIYTLDNELIKALVSPITLSVFAFIVLSSQLQPSSNRSKVQQPANSQIEDSSPSEIADITTLYIGNIPYNASESEIVHHFENISTVHSIRLMKDKKTGKRKGFGFIEVPPESADEIIKTMNKSMFMERSLIVRPAKDKVA